MQEPTTIVLPKEEAGQSFSVTAKRAVQEVQDQMGQWFNTFFFSRSPCALPPPDRLDVPRRSSRVPQTIVLPIHARRQTVQEPTTIVLPNKETGQSFEVTAKRAVVESRCALTAITAAAAAITRSSRCPQTIVQSPSDDRFAHPCSQANSAANCDGTTVPEPGANHDCAPIQGTTDCARCL